MTFEIADISRWYVMQEEPGGENLKDWLAERPDSPPSEWWLWKPSRRHGPRPAPQWTDDQSEQVVAALAALLDLPAAEVRLAARGSSRGSLSRMIVPEGWSRNDGDALLSEIDGYVSIESQRDLRPGQRSVAGYNLENIFSALDGVKGPPGTACEDWDAQEVFAGYLVLDAWTANTDRHARNWLVLDRAGERRIGRTFDHGSALGAGMDDRARARATDSVAAWCARGLARTFEDSPSLVGLAQRAVALAGGRAHEWLERLGSVHGGAWRGMLGTVPGMSVQASSFNDAVIEENRRRLLA